MSLPQNYRRRVFLEAPPQARSPMRYKWAGGALRAWTSNLIAAGRAGGGSPYSSTQQRQRGVCASKRSPSILLPPVPLRRHRSPVAHPPLPWLSQPVRDHVPSRKREPALAGNSSCTLFLATSVSVRGAARPLNSECGVFEARRRRAGFAALRTPTDDWV